MPFAEAAERLARGEWTVVVGTYDPLTAAQAHRLAQIDKRTGQLFAVVIDKGSPLLSGEARAVLIAALRSVDAVTVATEGDWQSLRSESGRVSIIEDVAAEQRRTAEFIEFVLERQAAGRKNGAERAS